MVCLSINTGCYIIWLHLEAWPQLDLGSDPFVAVQLRYSVPSAGLTYSAPFSYLSRSPTSVVTFLCCFFFFAPHQAFFLLAIPIMETLELIHEGIMLSNFFVLLSSILEQLSWLILFLTVAFLKLPLFKYMSHFL